MKALQKHKAIDIPVEHATLDLLVAAKLAEAEGETRDATKMYEQLLKTDKLNEYAYDRLMILYRKEKAYDKEMKIIDKGIAAYTLFYSKGKPSHKKSVADLSDKINKSVGLVDKKGNHLFEPEPIARWNKRKSVVEKKLK